MISFVCKRCGKEGKLVPGIGIIMWPAESRKTLNINRYSLYARIELQAFLFNNLEEALDMDDNNQTQVSNVAIRKYKVWH